MLLKCASREEDGRSSRPGAALFIRITRRYTLMSRPTSQSLVLGSHSRCQHRPATPAPGSLRVRSHRHGALSGSRPKFVRRQLRPPEADTCTHTAHDSDPPQRQAGRLGVQLSGLDPGAAGGAAVKYAVFLIPGGHEAPTRGSYTPPKQAVCCQCAPACGRWGKKGCRLAM